MTSIFLPFLRSLLTTPSQSSNPDPIYHVVHQTIRDQDRGGFTTPERQQDHLSYHDTGLRGINGANILLDSLALNPFAQKLTLSHNHLGDLGLQHLVIRSNSKIKELNLASNQITDIGFNTLLNHWLSSSSSKNQDQENCYCSNSINLNELYLSNNRISLSLQPSPLLYINNLSVLSLTSNPIHSPSLVSLFRNPSFSPKALKTLHLSACALDSTVAFALSGWLEDSNRSGRLEWLAVNGNNWGGIGCERIVWSLAKPNGNKNLLRVEMLACNLPFNHQPIDQFGNPLENLIEQEQVEILNQMPEFGTDLERAQARTLIDNEGGWKLLLERCELRNQVLRLAARRAALGVISTARIVLLSKPSSNKKSKNEIFNWNKLPEEIQFQIWRWVALLSAFPGLESHSINFRTQLKGNSSVKNLNHQKETDPLSEDTLNQSLLEIPDPLTTKQLLKVLNYSSNRKTIFQEISCRRKLEVEVEKKSSLRSRNGGGSSNHRKLIELRRFEHESDKTGQEMVLKACDCQRFEGRI